MLLQFCKAFGMTVMHMAARAAYDSPPPPRWGPLKRRGAVLTATVALFARK